MVNVYSITFIERKYPNHEGFIAYGSLIITVIGIIVIMAIIFSNIQVVNKEELKKGN